jgi:hypothetical protein
MVSMIRPMRDDRILEPCGGDGMFVDALLEHNPRLKIDTCDIDEKAIKTMSMKYDSLSNVVIRETDTLTDSTFDEYSLSGYYDKIIGNPPYGGWQEYERRAKLKRKYNGFYVKETYSLFLLRCVSLLKEEGLLSFIIPDTFLFLHSHKSLRKYLLEHTKIIEIAIFPSKFFPGVSFGYSNLCIITLKKFSRGLPNHQFSVVKGLREDTDLLNLSAGNNNSHLVHMRLSQKEVLANQDCVFLLSDKTINQSITGCTSKLSDFAACVTGIYCGDNKRFLAVEAGNKKEFADYPCIEPTEIDYFHVSTSPLEESKKYIPIVKGSSSTRYYRTADKWLIEWTPSALFYYNNDKKARFQNSQYYFRSGIALPMVKSSMVKATLMQNMVFDQSIVGIFPHDEKYTYYLLAYLNSEIANRFIHTINPTANNSANYLKKLPIHIPTEDELAYVNSLVESILSSQNANITQKDIDEFFEGRLAA